MSRLKVGVIWAEMARRKLEFHREEDWQTIKLWGLFNWYDVSRLIESGQLKTTMCKENRTIWVWPSEEAYMKKIKPLLDNYTLDELNVMSGWV